MLFGFRMIEDAALLHSAILAEQTLEKRPIYVVVQIGNRDFHLGRLANVMLIDLVAGRRRPISYG